MERLRITELLAEVSARRVTPMSHTELAALVFGSETGQRPVGGQRRPLSEARKRNLIVAWNQGRDLGALKPRHVLRLAEALRVTRIDQLFEK